MKRIVTVSLSVLLVAGCTDALAPVPEQESSRPSFSTATSDVTPPALSALDFNPKTINTTASSASITVDFTVTDDLSGATDIGVLFRSPSSGVFQSNSSSFAAVTSYTSSLIVSFPQFSEAGTWSVYQIFVIDAAGNQANFGSADLAALGFPTTLTVESVSDVTGPALTALGITPGTINTSGGSADVTVDFTVTDDLAGAVSIAVLFRSPSGGVFQSNSTSFPAATSYTGSLIVSFPQFSEDGTWSVYQIFVIDGAGNQANFFTADLATLGFPTTLVVQNTIAVAIDIKPGIYPNVIHCQATKNQIPVAILSGRDFDALTVDHTTVAFGPGAAAEIHVKNGQPVRHEKDVDEDGDLDLVFHFGQAGAGLACGMTEGVLTGRTLGGIPIRGVDAIVTQP